MTGVRPALPVRESGLHWEHVRRHEVIVLTEEGARVFMEAISNSPKPANAYLRRAAKRYRAAFGDR
jgi:uncharacterized protein (DUF1778 family)